MALNVFVACDIAFYIYVSVNKQINKYLQTVSKRQTNKTNKQSNNNLQKGIIIQT